jgi:acetyl-CoA carboxylase biotin carboxylase subunit
VPSPGRIERLRVPSGPGVRLDTHVDSGAAIPPHYDSLIAKLVVWDSDRPAAIARGLRALGELEIEGIATTRDFARDVLRSEAFVSGEYTTSYVDDLGAS